MGEDGAIIAALAVACFIAFISLRELRLGAEANLKAWEHARWLWDRLAEDRDCAKSSPSSSDQKA